MHHRSWALLLLLSATFAFAGQLAPKPQESYAPYWTSEPGWTTELQLKNNLLKASLTVTPVLRLASGKKLRSILRPFHRMPRFQSGSTKDSWRMPPTCSASPDLTARSCFATPRPAPEIFTQT